MILLHTYEPITTIKYATRFKYKQYWYFLNNGVEANKRTTYNEYLTSIQPQMFKPITKEL